MKIHNPSYHYNHVDQNYKVRCLCGWWTEQDTEDECQTSYDEHIREAMSLPALPVKPVTEHEPVKMEVVPLRKKASAGDIPKTLRQIAYDIENGVYDFEPDLAVLVVGRETVTKERDGGQIQNFEWTTHGLGEVSFFKTQGLLAAALYRADRTDIS